MNDLLYNVLQFTYLVIVTISIIANLIDLYVTCWNENVVINSLRRSIKQKPRGIAVYEQNIFVVYILRWIRRQRRSGFDEQYIHVEDRLFD